MIIKFTLTFLLISLVASVLPGQNISQCERDYSLLQEIAETSSEEIGSGVELFLSKSYLQAIEEGDYDRTPSGMQHWIYIRPASRKELREGLVKDNVREYVGNDGNVYGLTSTPSQVHFFQPTDVFGSDYAPVWEDPIMQVPPGLKPVNILQYANRLFVLKEKARDYVTLEVGGKPLVFYPGFPITEAVFDTERVLNQIAEKQNLAGALLNRNFLIRNSPNLHYRSRPGGLNHSLDSAIEYLKIEVTDVIATRNEVLLAYGENETLYLVVDAESDFQFYEMDCINEAQQARAVEIQESSEELNLRLNQMIRNDSALESMLQNGWLTTTLYERFKLESNGQRSTGDYQHVLLKDKENSLAPCLRPLLHENGEISLLSYYTSNHGLYHTKIELFIGEMEPLISQRISTLDPRSSRSHRDGFVIERIIYKDGADKGILEAIARHADQLIKVRFSAGGSFYKDIELSQEYKDAIRDAYLFSLVIKAEKE